MAPRHWTPSMPTTDFPEDGYEVVVAVPWRGALPYRAPRNPPNPDVLWDITQERPGYHLRASMLSLNSGRKILWVRLFQGACTGIHSLRQGFCRCIRQIAEAGKPIACLCHGIEILTAADCIQGKRHHRPEVSF